MTFLELVNLARSEAGVASGDLASFSNLSLESTRFKNWVAKEWELLQTEREDWQFLRGNFQFDTTTNQASYTPQQAKATIDGTNATASILADWKRDSLRLSTSGANYADEQLLGFMPWDTYRNLYQYGAMRSQRAKPVAYSIDPQKNLWFGIVPDGAYTVVGEFYRTPQSLSDVADVPLMPARFHPVIAYRALRAYGIFMAAPEVIGRADEKLGRLENDLLADQLPPMMLGEPLA